MSHPTESYGIRGVQQNFDCTVTNLKNDNLFQVFSIHVTSFTCHHFDNGKNSAAALATQPIVSNSAREILFSIFPSSILTFVCSHTGIGLNNDCIGWTYLKEYEPFPNALILRHLQFITCEGTIFKLTWDLGLLVLQLLLSLKVM